MFTLRPGDWPVSAWTLSTATPVPIVASRKLALPIVSSMRAAPNSATLLRIPTMLFFRALISAASRLGDRSWGVHVTDVRRYTAGGHSALLIAFCRYLAGSCSNEQIASIEGKCNLAVTIIVI